MKIRLVPDGIFPITVGVDGQPVKTATRFTIPGTLQGEGKLAGIPSLFVRLSGCNLRCAWYTPEGTVEICDTPYSSHHADNYEEIETAAVAGILAANKGNIRHVVITGGEPMMQAEAVAELSSRLRKEGFHITMESNATWFDADVARYIDLFSLSPKLSSSIPFGGKIAAMKQAIDPEFTARHKELYKNTRVIQQFIDASHHTSFYDDRPDTIPSRRTDKDFQLKFVVSAPEDVEEIENAYLARLHSFEPSDIILMPLGAEPEVIRQTSSMAAELAISRGWRYTPRLQIDLFGNKAGT